MQINAYTAQNYISWPKMPAFNDLSLSTPSHYFCPFTWFVPGSVVNEWLLSSAGFLHRQTN